MKRNLLILAMVCMPALLPAQSTATASPFSSTAGFAAYAYNKFHNDYDRFAFVYDWICRNVNYDKDSSLYFNWSASHEAKIEATLRRKKGVCENYASLLADIAGKLNIPVYVVHGYPAKQHLAVDDSHAWVAVQINREWRLCDPTWDATGTDARKYFLNRPENFIDTHIPFDPLWQLLEKPLYYKAPGNEYDYRDSVAAFLQLDSLQQLFATKERMQRSTISNQMIKNWQGLNNMNIAIIAGEKDEQLYNAAVKYYNEALKGYNSFIHLRNNQFINAPADAELQTMLTVIIPTLKDARSILKQLGSIRDNFQYDPSELLGKIDQLQLKTAEQEKFLRAYISSDSKEKKKTLLSN
jgi:hypothetical protein